MEQKEEIINFLRNMSNDVVADPDYPIYPECEGQGTEDGCPDHQNCGLCRYEYMKNKGWLASVVNPEPARMRELEEVCKILVAIIDEDYLPQIAKCTCQDYGRLNDGLIRARRVLSDGQLPT